MNASDYEWDTDADDDDNLSRPGTGNSVRFSDGQIQLTI